MPTEVIITPPPQQIAQLSTATVATVQIQFEIHGPLPDKVEIYASQVTGQFGNLVDTVDINSPEFQYIDHIQLQAGSIFNIGLCPRTETNGVLDDTINDAYWENSCVFVEFTTWTTSPPAPPPPRPPPSQIWHIISAQAKPFGKIVATWPSGWGVSDVVLRLIANGTLKDKDIPGLIGKNFIIDTGPFFKSETYTYEAVAESQGVVGLAISNAITYPDWLGLREFLPANFDPSLGIKRLLPNDHPFVSVRKIMSTYSSP